MKPSFCINCGAKHQYNFAQPKFCASCGSNLSGEPKKQAPIAKKTRIQHDEQDDDDDGESSDVDCVPDLSNLELEVEKDMATIHSLGSILQQTNDAPRRFSKRNLDLDQMKNSRGRQ